MNECATEGCERPARWISINEGNMIGDKAPYRCIQCCKAIEESAQNIRDTFERGLDI